MTVLARATDPVTSHDGAAGVGERAKSQRVQLLVAFSRHPDGLTADEAAAKAGLLHVGYWKRCSDLQTAGLIEPAYDDAGELVVRAGRAGSPQQVRVITAAGVLRLGGG